MASGLGGGEGSSLVSAVHFRRIGGKASDPGVGTASGALVPVEEAHLCRLFISDGSEAKASDPGVGTASGALVPVEEAHLCRLFISDGSEAKASDPGVGTA